MKHYSAASIERFVTAPLLEECEVAEALRSELIVLGHDDAGKKRLARRLGIRQPELTRILRGQIPLPDTVAAKLGYRRVTRFERVAPAAPHTGRSVSFGPAARAKPSERIS